MIGRRIAIAVATVVCVGLLFVLVVWPHRQESNRGHGPTRLLQVKVLGLASHNWASSFEGRLVIQESTPTPDAPPLSWAAALLPFLEQAQLYKQIDQSQPWTATANRDAFRREVDAFLNPAIRTPDNTWNAQGDALNHYAANQHLAESQDINHFDLLSRADGMANTVMYGEAAGEFRPWGEAGNWRDPGIGLNTSHAGFGGPKGVVVFAFCDGSVNVLSEDVNPAILRALATPDGGEEISSSDF
jgi:hypothetical protein